MLDLFKTYLHPRLISMIFLGFVCGLPICLTWSTLNYRLHDAGISLSVIGFFSWVGVPYSLKFLAGPILDHVSLPYLTKRFGKRRAWMLFTQSLMMIAIIGLGLSDPKESLVAVFIWALLVSTCSAFDQIAMAAYRIEILSKDLQALSSSLTILGYRLGYLISGAGALRLSTAFSWEVAYFIMSMCGIIGIITILLNPEPLAKNPQDQSNTFFSIKATILSFADLIKIEKIFFILSFVVFFRLGDHLMSGISSIFYASLGFTTIEIADIIKIYGLFPTLLGGVLGGMITNKIGIRKALLSFGILETLSPLFHILQWYSGKNFEMLYFTITIEHLTTGMAASAFMGYMAYLCSNTNITATRHSQLSSLKNLFLTMGGATAGFMIDQQGWPVFFIICTLISLPCLWMMFKMKENFPLHLEWKR